MPEPVFVTGTLTVAGCPAVTGTALSDDPASVPLTVGVPMVRSHEHPVSAGVDVVVAVVSAPAVLSPAASADVAATGVGSGSTAGNVVTSLAAPLSDDAVEAVPVVVAEVDDDEVVPVVAACRGCTSPDTSDVTVFSGLVPAVVSVTWLPGSGGSVPSSAWATPTPRSIKPPASNPA
ncbi:hypothetical protein AB0C24_19345 [Amycolatopsis japonica]|uniref:hypothetical protein n=1 Tax=Amycolatopsis japonica TaxID=208439 RepID=UPI0033FED063